MSGKVKHSYQISLRVFAQMSTSESVGKGIEVILEFK